MNEIKILRTKYCMSQGDLAKKLGCTQSHISGIENGRFFPSKRIIEKIQTIFGCDEKLTTFTHKSEIRRLLIYARQLSPEALKSINSVLEVMCK